MSSAHTELTRTRPLARTRLLVVEDDAEMRSWLTEILTASGARVLEAASGVEALSLLAHNGPFDLVVTDVWVPVPSGVQVAAMARTAGYAGPFLVVTAFPSEEVREFVGGLDHAALLSKPFGSDELMEVAIRLVSGQGGRAEPAEVE